MQSLTLALEKVDFLPPDRVTDDTSILTLKTLVFEPLLRWDNGMVRAALFSHWEHSDDGRRWQFFVRPGAVFHDAKPCTPHDIIAFITAILGSVDTFGMKWSYARYLAKATISAGPGNSVIVENPEPFADVLDIFAEFYICRLAPDGAATLGTGRYRVVALTPNASVTLERAGRDGHYRTITALAQPSADERQRMLRDGAVDAALNLERVEGRLAMDPAFAWGRALNTLSVMYYLNCISGLFTSPEARMAANLAVDRQALVQDLFGGLAKPSASIVSPFHLGMAQADLSPLPHDPARARALLDEVGGPSDIVLRTPTFMPERALEISHFVADALGRVGLNVTLDIEHHRPEYARQVGRKEIGDMAIFDSSPQSTYRILNDKISSETQAVWWQGYDDPNVEVLIRHANHAVVPMDRAAAYGRCMAALQANPPWLYLLHPIDVFAARHGLDGLTIDHKGVLNIA